MVIILPLKEQTGHCWHFWDLALCTSWYEKTAQT